MKKEINKKIKEKKKAMYALYIALSISWLAGICWAIIKKDFGIGIITTEIWSGSITAALAAQYMTLKVQEK